jgi:hypothetical protein
MAARSAQHISPTPRIFTFGPDLEPDRSDELSSDRPWRRTNVLASGVVSGSSATRPIGLIGPHFIALETERAQLLKPLAGA